MEVLILRSQYNPEGTAGKLFIDGELFCRTLERPFNDNKPNNPNTKKNDSSCIPEGKYKIFRDRTGRFQGFRIINVPNRKNIEIHHGNCIDDILGCVLVGSKLIEGKTHYKGKIYKYWLTSSKRTLEDLINRLPEEANLEISSNDSMCNVSESWLESIK